MNKDFSCRTCGHLRTVEWDMDGKAVAIYECDGMEDVALYPETTPVDSHFCALHTEREGVKRIREMGGMKIPRFRFTFHDEDYCFASDVARLEASHAELLTALQYGINIYGRFGGVANEPYNPGTWIDMARRAVANAVDDEPITDDEGEAQ